MSDYYIDNLPKQLAELSSRIAALERAMATADILNIESVGSTAPEHEFPSEAEIPALYIVAEGVVYRLVGYVIGSGAKVFLRPVGRVRTEQ